MCSLQISPPEWMSSDKFICYQLRLSVETTEDNLIAHRV